MAVWCVYDIGVRKNTCKVSKMIKFVFLLAVFLFLAKAAVSDEDYDDHDDDLLEEYLSKSRMRVVQIVMKFLDRNPLYKEFVDRHPEVMTFLARHPDIIVFLIKHKDVVRWLVENADRFIVWLENHMNFLPWFEEALDDAVERGMGEDFVWMLISNPEEIENILQTYRSGRW
ncbi:unnamed protein product [Soboliphyme baturini]|uniref:Uncharacterized protein n=1 Tax=Soboliphyme baturini TaxID=241478 RepID=A0A183IBN0_9BILA|nr:unnamed protein product [Soboliphyme baturini]